MAEDILKNIIEVISWHILYELPEFMRPQSLSTTEILRPDEGIDAQIQQVRKPGEIHLLICFKSNWAVIHHRGASLFYATKFATRQNVVLGNFTLKYWTLKPITMDYQWFVWSLPHPWAERWKHTAYKLNPDYGPTPCSHFHACQILGRHRPPPTTWLILKVDMEFLKFKIQTFSSTLECNRVSMKRYMYYMYCPLLPSICRITMAIPHIYPTLRYNILGYT